MSNTPLRSAVARRVRDRSTVARAICGNRCLKSSNEARRLPAVRDVQNPIARPPVSPRPLARVVATRTSICSSMERAIRRKSRPAEVGRMPAVDRSKIVAPTRCSSCRIERLNVDCLIRHASAAWRKLPKSAAMTACRSCRMSILGFLDSTRVCSEFFRFITRYHLTKCNCARCTTEFDDFWLCRLVGTRSRRPGKSEQKKRCKSRTAYAGQPQACVNRSSQNRSIHKLRVCLGSPERRRQIRRPPAIKYIVVRLVLGQFEPGAHSAGTWVVSSEVREVKGGSTFAERRQNGVVVQKTA